MLAMIAAKAHLRPRSVVGPKLVGDHDARRYDGGCEELHINRWPRDCLFDAGPGRRERSHSDRPRAKASVARRRSRRRPHSYAICRRAGARLRSDRKTLCRISSLTAERFRRSREFRAPPAFPRPFEGSRGNLKRARAHRETNELAGGNIPTLRAEDPRQHAPKRCSLGYRLLCELRSLGSCQRRRPP
jgi:hypothetical protein